MRDKSLVFRLRDERVRGAAANEKTVCRWPGSAEPFDARAEFCAHYPAIRAAFDAHRRQGALLMAFDDAPEPLGIGWVEASLDRARAAIVGRHGSVGLVIPDEHGRVSLRHLAVIVRAQSHDDVRVRVVDLHSGVGFSDESGRALEGVTADGSLFLKVAGVTLMILQTGDGHELPADPNLAYDAIPARIFAEAATFEQRGARRAVRVGGGQDQTAVLSIAGPLTASASLLDAGEPAYAELVLEGQELCVTRRVGASALDRGVLVGRYSRCDVRTGADSDDISRVHLLVIRDGSDVLAIDTGSSNGSFVDGQKIRYATLEASTRVALASGALVVGVERLS